MNRILRIAAVLLLLGFSACDMIEPFQFATFRLDDGRVGQVYADTIRTNGGYGTVTMRLIDGQLPPGVGLRVAKSDGILYGVPSRAGDFQFTVEARDAADGGESRRDGIITQGFAITIDSQ